MKQVRGIWLPDDDTHFQQALFKGLLFHGKGTYQMGKIEQSLDCVMKRGLALDIGAHVGLWSRVLSYHFKQVCAFEPVRELHPCLELNLKDCPNVNLFHFALGRQNGEIGVTYKPGNSGNSGVAIDGYRVDIHTLDSLAAGLSQGIDFIKIDVEGYEVEVLRGGENVIRYHKPVIVVEQKLGNAERYGFKQFEAIELLESWGFKRKWSRSGDYCYGWQ